MEKIKKIKVQNWKDLCITSSETFEYDMGMRVTQGNKKPKIELFALQNSLDAADLGKSVYKLCSNIIENHFPEKKVTDFDWEYTVSYGHTEINFIEQQGHIIGVKFSNSYPLQKNYCMISNIEQYEEILLDRKKPLCGMTDREFRFYYKNPSEKVIVPLPHHPDGHLIMGFPNYSDPDHYTQILVDSELFMKLWIDQTLRENGCKSMDCLQKAYEDFPIKGDDSPYPPFHCSLQDSIDHINPSLGYPNDFPVGVFRRQAIQEKGIKSLVSKWTQKHTNKADEKISFTNGRHRTLNLYKAGAPFIPMAINKGDDLVEFKKRFEWHGYNDDTPDLKPHLVYQ